MYKQTLSELFNSKIFSIPDYQRGYAWGEKQWNDFIQDIEALATDDYISYHYAGTVVIYDSKNKTVNYNRKNVPIVDIVDGQQRLTTICIYLSIIIDLLIKKGETDYTNDIAEFLFHNATCKLTLNNDSNDLFYQLLKEGKPRTTVVNPHQKRLVDAYKKFLNHVQEKIDNSNNDIEYLKKLFGVITGKLSFTYYAIEEECEIGMTFELMNSRGKALSVFELLKNYFMYWISRNGTSDEERKALTNTVNSAWRDIYSNIGNSSGNEEQCLRVAWILYCSHWIGVGFSWTQK